MPLKWKSKILLAKIETVYGTDSAPTGGANAILATQVQLTPMEGNDISRELELPWLGGQATIPAELHMSLRYRVELAPSGAAGVVPAWGMLMRACGCAEVVDAGESVTYNPVSDGHESVTHHFWIAGTRFVLRGGRGTCVIRATAQGVPYLEFEFRGLFSPPAETARPAVVLTNFQKPDVVTSAATPICTLDAVPFVMRTFSLNLGNQLENRFLVGSEGILISDRTDQIEMTVEAVPLTTFDPFAKALAQADVVGKLQHGTVAGRIATLDFSKGQMQRPSGLENQQNIVEWPLRLVALPTAGDDQWTLTLT